MRGGIRNTEQVNSTRAPLHPKAVAGELGYHELSQLRADPMKVQFRCPPELTGILPQPFAAKRGLPEWLKRMAATAPSDDVQGEIRTVKQCPPFVDAMGFGFMVPLATDIRVDHGTFEWNWELGPSSVGSYPRSPLSFHLSEQLTGAPIADKDSAAIKFTNYWTIETPPGYALLVTHPFNREELPFRTLTGLVDTDRYKDGCIQFPALWRDPDFVGVLERGLPIAQCLPVPRDALTLEFGELVGGAAQDFMRTQEQVNAQPGAYRRHYRVPKPGSD
jgi:hypothetical protein